MEPELKLLQDRVQGQCSFPVSAMKQKVIYKGIYNAHSQFIYRDMQSNFDEVCGRQQGWSGPSHGTYEDTDPIIKRHVDTRFGNLKWGTCNIDIERIYLWKDSH